MSNLFTNVSEGAITGGIIGAAVEALLVGGATLVAGPAGAALALALAPEVMGTGTAVGTVAGAGAGAVKTAIEEIDQKTHHKGV